MAPVRKSSSVPASAGKPQALARAAGGPAGEILLYRTEDGRTRVECWFADESLWMSQALMAELFQTTPQNVTQHLKALYDEGEIEEEATCKSYLQVRSEGQRQVRRRVKHYNLDAILAVGYRVRSPRGTQFRCASTNARCWAAPARSAISRRWKGRKPSTKGSRPAGGSCWRPRASTTASRRWKQRRSAWKNRRRSPAGQRGSRDEPHFEPDLEFQRDAIAAVCDSPA